MIIPENITDSWSARNGGTRPGPVTTALIDMDGTLYDSMPWHARAWHRMVTELGLEATVDEFFAYEGMTGRATINHIFQRAFGHDATPDEAERLYQLKTEYFRELNHVDVMPGAKRMLDILRQADITPVLVTGSGQSSLLNRLDQDFNNAFNPAMRVTSHDVTHGKPHPEPYLRGLAISHTKAVNAISVENAPLGVESASRAGVFTIAVSTGPIPIEELWRAGADIVFNSMTECADSLARLLCILNKHN